jgi:hypothetical protein
MNTVTAEIGDLFNEEFACTPLDAITECRACLTKLPASPWRSLGEYLDYTSWEGRERFAQLDMEIRARKIQQARINARSRHFAGLAASNLA